MITVCCVKWGTRYSAAYVNYLHRMVSSHMAMPFQFVCATDNPVGVGCETIPLSESIPPGWWAKMDLFHPRGAFGQITGRVLYLDLDVVIVGDLTALVEYPSEFAMHHDFQKPWRTASAVMVLDAGTRGWVWEKFQAIRGKVMQQFHGDQDYLYQVQMEECRWPNTRPFADYFPQRWIRSYRIHSIKGPSEGCKVVCFHGDPKPDACGGWVQRIWEGWSKR